MKKKLLGGLLAITTIIALGVATAPIINNNAQALTRTNNTYSCNDIVFSESVNNPGAHSDITDLSTKGVTSLNCSMTDWTNANYAATMTNSAIKLGESESGKFNGSVKLTLNNGMTAGRAIVYATGWNKDSDNLQLGINGNYQNVTTTSDNNYIFSPYIFEFGEQISELIFSNNPSATGKSRVVISKIVLRLYGEQSGGGGTPVDPGEDTPTIHTVKWNGTTALPGTATVIDNSPITIKVSSTNTYSNPIRVYANTTITITATDGYKIVEVIYEASSTGNYVTYAQNAIVNPNVTPTVNNKEVSWVLDNALEFTFKPSSQTRCKSITIKYTK